MTQKFYVVSGRPAGELEHRAVFGPYCHDVAEFVQEAVYDAISDQANWLNGPHITQNVPPNAEPIEVGPRDFMQFLGV